MIASYPRQKIVWSCVNFRGLQCLDLKRRISEWLLKKSRIGEKQNGAFRHNEDSGESLPETPRYHSGVMFSLNPSIP